MKLVLLIFLGLSFYMLVLQPTKAATPPFIIRKCVNHTQVSVIDLALFFGTDFMVVSKSVKCYFNCLFEFSGMLIEGKINKEMVNMAHNETEAAKIRSVIEVCDSLDEEDVCEAGYQFFKCFITYKAKNGN